MKKGKRVRFKFAVKKAYLKSDWGYKVIIPGRDGMHSTIERRLTKDSADELAGALERAHSEWVKYAKEKAVKNACQNCKGSGDYDGSACLRCGGDGKEFSDVRNNK